MTPNEYVKFREAFIRRGDKENFYLQELGESNGMVVYSKMRLNNSCFIEEATKNYDIHQGVFVDIMIQHVFPRMKIAQYWMVACQAYLELKALANRDYYKRGRLFNIVLRPLRWLPKRFLLDFSLRQVWRYKDKKTDNYFHYYIGQPLSRSIYPSSIFEKYILMDFETIQLKAPQGVNNYLSILFGDFMKIPNLDSIRWHQHANEWSPNVSFEKVGKGNFEYERNLW
jgi:lipopolysaccharide cholinephosphotransferase